MYLSEAAENTAGPCSTASHCDTAKYIASQDTYSLADRLESHKSNSDSAKYKGRDKILTSKQISKYQVYHKRRKSYEEYVDSKSILNEKTSDISKVKHRDDRLNENTFHEDFTDIRYIDESPTLSPNTCFSNRESTEIYNFTLPVPTLSISGQNSPRNQSYSDEHFQYSGKEYTNARNSFATKRLGKSRKLSPMFDEQKHFFRNDYTPLGTARTYPEGKRFHHQDFQLKNHHVSRHHSSKGGKT